MKLVAFTEDVADLKVRYSVLHLDKSAMVWADAVSAAHPAKRGSLPSLALSMPARVAGGDPSTATVLPGAHAQASKALSEALTRSCGIAVHAHISVPPGAEPLTDSIALRLQRELRSTRE